MTSYVLQRSPIYSWVDSKQPYTLEAPVESVAHFEVNATTNNSLPKVQFQQVIPKGVILDPTIKVLYHFEFEVHGNANGAPDGGAVSLFEDQKMGLSHLAVYEAVTDIQLRLNGGSIGRSPRDYIYALSKFQNTTHDQLSSDGTMLGDLFPKHDDSLLNSALLNPFSKDNMNNRASLFKVTSETKSTSAGGACSFKAESTLLTCIPISCINSAGYASGLCNIQQLSIDINLDGTAMHRMFSCWKTLSDARKISNVIVTLKSIPRMFYSTSQANPHIARQLVDPSTGIPKTIRYPFENVHTYVGQFSGNIPAGAVNQDLDTQVKQLSAIPSKILLWVEPQRKAVQQTSGDGPHPVPVQGDDCAKTRVFGRIESLKVSILGKEKSFDSVQMLYEISSRNGLKLPYTMAYSHTGFPVLLDVCKDIGLSNTLVGSTTNSMLFCKLKYSTLSGEDEQFRANMTLVDPGILTVDGTSSNVDVSKSLSITDNQYNALWENLSSNDSASTGMHLGGSFGQNQGNNAFGVGGAWYNDLWSGIKSVASTVGNAVLPVLAKRIVGGNSNDGVFHSGGNDADKFIVYSGASKRVATKKNTKRGGAIENDPLASLR